MISGSMYRWLPLKTKSRCSDWGLCSDFRSASIPRGLRLEDTISYQGKVAARFPRRVSNRNRKTQQLNRSLLRCRRFNVHGFGVCLCTRSAFSARVALRFRRQEIKTITIPPTSVRTSAEAIIVAIINFLPLSQQRPRLFAVSSFWALSLGSPYTGLQDGVREHSLTACGSPKLENARNSTGSWP
jgi:hypothetical protein